jgi:hypothetical protein
LDPGADKNNWKNDMTNLQDDKPLAGASQRKAGIISIHRLAGVDAVCLYALCDLDPAIEHSDVLELSEFLNRYITNALAAGSECCGDATNDLAIHVDAPIEWHLGNFARYVKDHRVTPGELQMMIDVAIGARVVICSKVGAGETANIERPNVELTGAAPALSAQRPATEGSEVERHVRTRELLKNEL